MKKDNCPICSWTFSNGSFKSATYPIKTDEHSQGTMPTTIRFCGRCGVGVAFPPLSEEELAELYAQGEYWHKASSEPSLKVFPVPFGLAQARWKLIEKSLPQSKKVGGIRILDVGAGHGYMGLVASKSHNVAINQYAAVEADPAMRQYLQKIWKAWRCKPELDVTTSIEQTTGEYDVSVLSHILEHVQEPLSLIKLVVARLSPGGLLFLDVPNQDYLFKEDVFPHILFFSPSSLRFLLGKEPLEIISIGTWGRNMYKSPLHAKAPRSIKLTGRMVQRFYSFLPSRFLVCFYAWYFGVNHMDISGTWVRALCRRK